MCYQRISENKEEQNSGIFNTLGCNMSVKMPFLDSHNDYFPENLGHNKGHTEFFPQDIIDTVPGKMTFIYDTMQTTVGR